VCDCDPADLAVVKAIQSESLARQVISISNSFKQSSMDIVSTMSFMER